MFYRFMMDEHHMPPWDVNRLTPYQIRVYTCDDKWLRQVSSGKASVSPAEVERFREEAAERRAAMTQKILERI